MDKAGKALEEVAATLTAFKPTVEMRRVKSKLLARIADDPTKPAGSLLTRSTAESLVGRSLEKWWKIEGFQSWISNSTEFTERLEGLAMQAMETLEDVMAHSQQDSARVNAAKVAMELASKFPRQKTEREENEYLNMDRETIIKYIKTYAPSLLKEASEPNKDDE